MREVVQNTAKNVEKCNENQWILMLKGVWRSGGEGAEKLGPAEYAMAASAAHVVDMSRRVRPKAQDQNR